MNIASNDFSETAKYEFAQYLRDSKRPENKTRGVSQTLSKLEDIESTLSDPRSEKMSNEELLKLGTDLKQIRVKIESLANMDVLDNEDQEKKWIEEANGNLAERLKQENILNLSIRDILQEVLITWDVILRRLLDEDLYKWNHTQEWHINVFAFLGKLSDIFVNREKLLYVGIGVIILSAFVYFIFVTE